MLDRFGVDTVELGREFALAAEDWSEWRLPDGTPCRIPALIQPVKEESHWNTYHVGGFVFQPIHNIMADVPPQNVVALLEAVNVRDM